MTVAVELAEDLERVDALIERVNRLSDLALLIVLDRELSDGR